MARRTCREARRTCGGASRPRDSPTSTRSSATAPPPGAHPLATYVLVHLHAVNCFKGLPRGCQWLFDKASDNAGYDKNYTVKLLVHISVVLPWSNDGVAINR